MPVFNGAVTIGGSLASLSAQRFNDFEVLVVDDCSTDATREIVRNHADRRIHLIAAAANGGPVAARNLAVARARGRYLAALDADDLAHPDRFARQVTWLDGHPGCVLVATDAEILVGTQRSPSRQPPVTTPALLAWLLKVRNPFVWSSVMLRADALAACGGLNRQERIYAEDFDLYHRIAAQGTIARIDAPLTTYRDHAGGISKRFEGRMRDAVCAVLGDAHRPVFGEAAVAAAALVADHAMLGHAVPDRATLAQLGAVIGRLLADHLATARPGGEDRRLIKWEAARLWWRIGRHAVRSGSLGLPDLLAVRPDHLGLGYAGLDDLLLSGALGTMRARRAG